MSRRRSGAPLRAAVKPRESKTREPEEKSRDPMLRVVMAGTGVMSRKERGKRLRRLSPIDDRDRDQRHPEDDRENDENSPVLHVAILSESADGAGLPRAAYFLKS